MHSFRDLGKVKPTLVYPQAPKHHIPEFHPNKLNTKQPERSRVGEGNLAEFYDSFLHHLYLFNHVFTQASLFSVKWENLSQHPILCSSLMEIPLIQQKSRFVL